MMCGGVKVLPVITLAVGSLVNLGPGTSGQSADSRMGDRVHCPSVKIA